MPWNYSMLYGPHPSVNLPSSVLLPFYFSAGYLAWLSKLPRHQSYSYCISPFSIYRAVLPFPLWMLQIWCIYCCHYPFNAFCSVFCSMRPNWRRNRMNRKTGSFWAALSNTAALYRSVIRQLGLSSATTLRFSVAVHLIIVDIMTTTVLRIPLVLWPVTSQEV